MSVALAIATLSWSFLYFFSATLFHHHATSESAKRIVWKLSKNPLLQQNQTHKTVDIVPYINTLEVIYAVTSAIQGLASFLFVGVPLLMAHPVLFLLATLFITLLVVIITQLTGASGGTTIVTPVNS